MTSPTRATNRRAGRRLRPRVKVKVTCRKGTLDLGPNVALGLLDISETGCRLLHREALPAGQEVFLTLDGPTGGRPARRAAMVVWSVAAAAGTFAAGVCFDKALGYATLPHLGHD
jgi:hypothetical protein